MRDLDPITVEIRSTLAFPVTWAPVAKLNLAPTIFWRLRQRVPYRGGPTPLIN
eukprot:SAG11_NODE_17998_length_502_cov_4.029777_1_plen_53_part_00